MIAEKDSGRAKEKLVQPLLTLAVFTFDLIFFFNLDFFILSFFTFTSYFAIDFDLLNDLLNDIFAFIDLPLLDLTSDRLVCPLIDLPFADYFGVLEIKKKKRY